MMKLLFTIAAFMITSVAYGQGIYNKAATNIKQNRMMVDSVLGVPRDTSAGNLPTYLTASVGDSGRLAFHLGRFWGHTATGWKGFSYTDEVPTGVLDSARRSNDTLYFRLTGGGELAVKIEGILQTGVVGLVDSLSAQTLQRVTDKDNRTTQGMYASYLELNTTRTGGGALGGAVLLQRTISGSNVRAKGVVDNTTVNITSGSYASFDALMLSTANDVDTIVALQSRMEINTSDTVDKINAVYHYPSVTSGHVRKNYSLEIRDIQNTGGTIGETVGLLIHPLNYATTNQAIRIEDGAYTSYIGSNTGFGKSTPVYPVEIKNGVENVSLKTDGRIIVGSTKDSKDSAAVHIIRTADPSVDENGRGFRDDTQFGRLNRSYANFDAVGSLTGVSHNHIIGYQSRISSRASSNVTSMIGVGVYDSIFSATVSQHFGVEIGEVGLSGGSLANNYGILVRKQTVGTNRWGMLVETSGSQNAIEVKHDASGSITQTLYNRTTAGVGDQSLVKWKTSTLEGAGIGMEVRSSTVADMIFKTNSTGTTNLTEKARLTGAGLFGVGLTPTANIHSVGSFATGITTVTGNTTLTVAHHTVLVNNTGTATITLPAASTCSGWIYVIKKISAAANDVVIDANASELIDGATTKTQTLQWSVLQLQSNGTAWSIIGGHANSTVY